MTDLTEEQEIELEMERQDADTEQDLLDRIADAFDRAEKGTEVEAIWAVIEPALAISELGDLRAKLANEAQRTREIESTCNRLLTSAVELRAERDEHADRLHVTSGAYDRLDAQKRDAEGVRDRWKARAEQAEAAIERVTALQGRSSMGRVNDYVPLADVRAALSAPHSPAEPVSPVSTPTEAHGETGEAQEARQ